jgi:hypothetical protein
MVQTARYDESLGNYADTIIGAASDYLPSFGSSCAEVFFVSSGA